MWLSLLDFKIADVRLAAEMSTRFLDLLPTRTLLFPYPRFWIYLQQKNYQLHLITNGFERLSSKLKYSGLSSTISGKLLPQKGSNSLKPQEIF